MGTFLLLFGGFLFILSPSGEKYEKVGIFLMGFGGVLLGMGYTAYIAWKE